MGRPAQALKAKKENSKIKSGRERLIEINQFHSEIHTMLKERRHRGGKEVSAEK